MSKHLEQLPKRIAVNGYPPSAALIAAAALLLSRSNKCA